MKYLSFISSLLLAACGILLLAIPFFIDSSPAGGIVMDNLFRFHYLQLFFAGSMALAAIVTFKHPVHLQWADFLIVLFFFIVLLTYDRELAAEPEKLLFGGQMVVLWFMLRHAFMQYPRLYTLFLAVIIIMGMLEAVWGMEQLYGYRQSNHSLFRLTGTFFNPGPYSGFLAMILPVCLGGILLLKGYKNTLRWSKIRTPYYFLWFCFFCMSVVLPAGMSRTAWIAALVSCGWVYWISCIGREKTVIFFNKHRRSVLLALCIGAVLLTAGIAGIYHLKKDSAEGRLLMWQMSIRIIKKYPLTGTGLGGFPAAYAEAQADYFSSGKASDTEKRVAGSPEYAFNEFLHIGTEQGLAGLLAFAGWLGYCFYEGIKRKRYGAAGGSFSLAIFSFASYPLQLPVFWIYLIFLTAICVTGEKKRQKVFGIPRLTTAILPLLVLVSFGLSYYGLKRKPAYRKWQTAKHLYHTHAWESAWMQYEPIYQLLRHRPDFLFEAAQCLNKTGNYEVAGKLLERGAGLSSDPMFYYILARTEQAQGRYDEAEQHLRHAIEILPERLYPYYLLAKLYAEPSFYSPDKLRMAIDSVLTKEPKVNSTAIREMREEAEALLRLPKNGS